MPKTKRLKTLRNKSGDDLYEFDPDFVKKISHFFNPLEKYFRYEVLGLKNVPKKGSALVVMNHGIIPYHGFLFAKKLVEELHTFPRGLAASFLFDIPWIKNLFLKGGAVNADPVNARKLLSQHNIVFLAPGGIYEALLAKKGMRRIPWERRKGFVRLAIETKTPIVPTYCHGINGAYINSYFLLKPRIKILEWTRFSMPFFFGLGPLPFPTKLTHVVGKPIFVKAKRGESHSDYVNRFHKRVLDEMTKLAKEKV